jgi:hypothetical protein
MRLHLPSSRTKILLLRVMGVVVILSSELHAGDSFPWDRVVIIGASVSHGFTASEAFGGPKTPQYALDLYLNAALAEPHQPIRNLANPLFYLMADDMGHSQIRDALTNNPTLVVGLDFLFWFCYGRVDSEQDRLVHFEKGLRLLEEIECPLVIGDIPDESGASKAMLPPVMIPNANTLAAANRRLKKWAAERKHVTIVPLSESMRLILGNQKLVVHGHAMAAGTTLKLLQADRLHPSHLGCSVLAIAIYDAYAGKHSDFPASAVRWDPDDVLKQAGF